MKIKNISINNQIIVEVQSKKILIKDVQDALDLMANVSSNYLILHEYNFEKKFFDLKTRIAGEILQKFTNYFVKVAIVGDFTKFPSKSLQAFIYENNKIGDYLFVGSVEGAINIWRVRI